MKSIFQIYYETIVGAFFSASQKIAILKLFAYVEGVDVDSDEYGQLKQTVDEVESLQLDSRVDCANWFFLRAFSKQPAPPIKADAVCALSRALERNISFCSAREWHQAMQKFPDAHRFGLAMLEYCHSNTEGAIQHLKMFEKENPNDLLAIELLAYLCFQTHRYEECYHFLSLAKGLYKKTHLSEKCWISRLTQQTEAKLTPQQMERIQAETARRVNTSSDTSDPLRSLDFASYPYQIREVLRRENELSIKEDLESTDPPPPSEVGALSIRERFDLLRRSLRKPPLRQDFQEEPEANFAAVLRCEIHLALLRHGFETPKKIYSQMASIFPQKIMSKIPLSFCENTLELIGYSDIEDKLDGFEEELVDMVVSVSDREEAIEKLIKAAKKAKRWQLSKPTCETYERAVCVLREMTPEEFSKRRQKKH